MSVPVVPPAVPLPLHPLRGGGAFQGLHPRFLIQGQDDFAALPQPVDSLVKPEDFEGAFDGFRIPDGGLPRA